MMKKITTLLMLSLLMIVALPLSAFATAADDLSGLTETIVISVNDLLGDKLSRKATVDDVDFTAAFKVYVGADIFKQDTTDLAFLKKTLEAGDYIYELPLYIDGDTVLVDIAKGQPLSENTDFSKEERENILANVGKWQVTAVKYYDNEIVNYVTDIKNKIGEVPEGTVLVGGLPRFRFAVALLPNAKGKVEGLLPLSELPGESNLSAFRSANQNVYDYVQIRDYVNKLPPPNPNEAGGFGFTDVRYSSDNPALYVLIIGVSIVCSAGIIFVILKKRAKTAK